MRGKRKRLSHTIDSDAIVYWNKGHHTGWIITAASLGLGFAMRTGTAAFFIYKHQLFPPSSQGPRIMEPAVAPGRYTVCSTGP